MMSAASRTRVGSPDPVRIGRRTLLRWCLGGSAGLALSAASCAGPARPPAAGPTGPGTGPQTQDSGFVFDWFDLAQGLIRSTAGYTPPVAARVFGYLGVILHVAVAPGPLWSRSLGGRLLDAPGRAPAGSHGPLVAHHAMAAALRHLFPTMSDDVEATDQLERSAAPALHRGMSDQVARRSRRHGQLLADAIYEWSRTDGGHDGHLHNVPTEYRPPKAPGLWRPTPPAYSVPVQPTWGGNRTFCPGSWHGCRSLHHCDTRPRREHRSTTRRARSTTSSTD